MNPSEIIAQFKTLLGTRLTTAERMADTGWGFAQRYVELYEEIESLAKVPEIISSNSCHSCKHYSRSYCKYWTSLVQPTDVCEFWEA